MHAIADDDANQHVEEDFALRRRQRCKDPFIGGAQRRAHTMTESLSLAG
jgi:hypothetical protein